HSQLREFQQDVWVDRSRHRVVIVVLPLWLRPAVRRRAQFGNRTRLSVRQSRGREGSWRTTTLDVPHSTHSARRVAALNPLTTQEDLWDCETSTHTPFRPRRTCGCRDRPTNETTSCISTAPSPPRRRS